MITYNEKKKYVEEYFKDFILINKNIVWEKLKLRFKLKREEISFRGKAHHITNFIDRCVGGTSFSNLHGRKAKFPINSRTYSDLRRALDSCNFKIAKKNGRLQYTGRSRSAIIFLNPDKKFDKFRDALEETEG